MLRKIQGKWYNVQVARAVSAARRQKKKAVKAISEMSKMGDNPMWAVFESAQTPGVLWLDDAEAVATVEAQWMEVKQSILVRRQAWVAMRERDARKAAANAA